MSVAPNIPYDEFYLLTGIGYDHALDLIKDHKLSASFRNGEMFVNVASVRRYMDGLAIDHPHRQRWTVMAKRATL